MKYRNFIEISEAVLYLGTVSEKLLFLRNNISSCLRTNSSRKTKYKWQKLIFYSLETIANVLIYMAYRTSNRSNSHSHAGLKYARKVTFHCRITHNQKIDKVVQARM
jgi:hypothetical protein